MTHDQCLEEEKSSVGATILVTFLIIIFFLVFYIQPSYSKTRMEYFNIKIRLLIRKTHPDRLSGENYQRVSA